MNAPRRHKRPEPIFTSTTRPAKGGEPKTGGATKPMFDMFGEKLGKKKWAQSASNKRKTWGA